MTRSLVISLVCGLSVLGSSVVPQFSNISVTAHFGANKVKKVTTSLKKSLGGHQLQKPHLGGIFYFLSTSLHPALNDIGNKLNII